MVERESKSKSVCSDGTVDLNTIAHERQRLEAFTEAGGFGLRRKHSIGLINSLASYEYFPFWHSLLSALGYQVMVSRKDRMSEFNGERLDTILSNRICTPAKSANELVLDMIDRGVEAVFMPVYDRQSRCPVFCGYGRLIRSNIPALMDGSVALIDPLLASAEIRDLFDVAGAFTSVHEALIAFDADTAPTSTEFTTALRSAIDAQREFDEQGANDVRRAMEWIYSNNAHHGIIIVGRPYQLAIDQLQAIDENLAQRGFAVLSPMSVRLTLADLDMMRNVTPAMTFESLTRRIAETSIDEPGVSVLFIQSDHCSFDTLLTIEARQILVDGHRRTAVILLDEEADAGAIDSQIEGFTRDILAEKRQKELEDTEVLTPAQAISLLVGNYDAESDRIDLRNIRDALPQHLCKGVESLFSMAESQLISHPESSVVQLPLTCKDCLAASLPSLLSHKLGREITVTWNGVWRFPEESLRQPWAFEGKESPRIGLAGHPLLCFDPAITGPIVSLISEYGGSVVLPDPDRFNGDELGYVDQLDEFRDQGIDGVLYLQYPDCLKSFVSGYGAIRVLQQRYPDMPLVAIDFDSNTTPIQLENRISLIIATARNNLRR